MSFGRRVDQDKGLLLFHRGIPLHQISYPILQLSVQQLQTREKVALVAAAILSRLLGVEFLDTKNTHTHTLNDTIIQNGRSLGMKLRAKVCLRSVDPQKSRRNFLITGSNSKFPAPRTCSSSLQHRSFDIHVHISTVDLKD